MHTIAKISFQDLLKLNINIPNIQRIKDTVKINQIVEYQEQYFREHKHFNFMGVLCLNVMKTATPLIYYLIDGQHRYNAIMQLQSRGYAEEIYVEFIDIQSENEMKDNYNLVNKNTPLPKFPESINKDIPEQAFIRFENLYPDYYSLSTRPRRPNLNKTHFQEALAYLTEKINVKCSSDLFNIVNDYNKNLSNWSSYPKDVSESMLEKCKKNGFYLGIFVHKSEEYCYEWVRKIVSHQTGEDIKDKPKPKKSKKPPKKTTIPPQLKRDIWDKWIGDNATSSKCYCCRETKISSTSYHAGHVISEHDSGSIDINNLRPVCPSCNQSMGTTNMRDYIQKYYPKNLKAFDKNWSPNRKSGFFFSH